MIREIETIQFNNYIERKEIIVANQKIGRSIKDIDNHTLLVYEELQTNEELANIDKQSILMLYVTRLDFIKILEELGLTWTNIKALMEQYPEVEKELTMCSNVYRGNSLIDPMIQIVNKTFGLNITSKNLDDKFCEKCGYVRRGVNNDNI